MANLNETISEIKDTFADIRSAIIEKGVEVGECESPTVYAERILDIQSGSGSGEGGISTISADAEAYEVYGEPEASVEITDADDGSTRLAFKFGIARGRTGAQGPKGEDGEPGATGRPGKDAVTFEYIYKRTNSSSCTAPTDSLQQDGYEPKGGSKEVLSVKDDEQYVFESRRQKVNNVGSSGSTPAIGAKGGVEGKDGKGIEYIYCLGDNPSTAPKVPKSDKNKDEDYITFPLVAEDGTNWNDDPQNVSEGNSICGVSIRKQKEEGTQLVGSEYSTPSIWAKGGKDGKEGGGRIVFIFTGTETLVNSINKPENITWNPTTNVITIPKGSKWKDNVDKVTEKYKGVSTASFTGAGTISSAGGSEPFCMTGEDGKPGEDGDSRQFIFRKISNLDNFYTLYNFHRTQKELYDSTNGLEGSILGDTEIPSKLDKLITVPEDLENGNEVDGYYTIVDTEGTDDATGVDPDNYRIEASCSRKREGGKWGAGSLPTIGSKGGEDGTDGAGIEYVYKITPVPEPEEKADGTLETFDEATERVRNNLYNEIFHGSNLPEFQSDSFLKNIDDDEIGGDGTDEPQDVGPNEPGEGVSIRRKKTNGEGSNFETPKIGSKWTDDASSCFTSIVFTRSKDKPSTPNGGSYHTPNPGGIGHDSLPAKDNNNGKIGMSQRTFCYPNEIDDDWSDPLEMSDSDRFQVEFSLGYENADGTIDINRRPSPDNFGGYNTEDAGRTAPNQKSGNGSDGEVSNPVWMITCNRVDGIGTEGSVMRVLAEKGEKGDPGTSVKIEGKFDSLADLKAEGEKYKANPETYTGIFVLPLEQGDGYLVDGYLYVYSGHYDDDTTFEECWLNAGQIKGEPGDDAVTYELFIRYSDFSDGNPMKDVGNGGKYIGTLSTFKKDGSYDKDPTKYGSYTGSPWSGEDGGGYEQVFLCTSSESGFDFSNPLPIPDESEAVLDFRPKHNYEPNIARGETDNEGNTVGSDRPIQTNAEGPYCGSVSRKVKGSEFGKWTGAKYNDVEGAEIYDRYIRDGHEIYHLELSEDQVDIPMDGDKVDSDFTQEILTSASLYIGNDLEDNNVTYHHSGPKDAIEVDGHSIKVTNGNALIRYTKIIISAYLDDVEVAKKTVYLHFTPNAYSLSTDVKVLTRDLIEDTVSPNQVTITAKKGNGKEGLSAIGHYITVDCNHLSDNYENSHTSRDYELNADGTYTISLNDESNFSSIDIYLKKDINDDSANLAWEHIGVVQNGEDGTNIEYIYLLKNEESAPDNPTPETPTDDYQNPDGTPKNSDGKDNPQNVSVTNKYQYVSVRERKNGIGGSFSNPVLGSVYSEKGDDAISYKHAFAFCRTNSDISNIKPTGGTFANPKPNSGENILGEDSVPSGDAQLGMVSCIVNSESNSCNWSFPKLMTDTADLQIEYTLQDLGVLDSYSPIKFDDPKVLTNMTDGKSQEDAGRELEAASDEKVVWNDNVPNALYMAVATCHNGVGSDGSVVRIKGEPGDKGDPGTSVKIVGSAYKVNTNPTTLSNKYSTTEEEVTKYWMYLYYNNSMYYGNESTYEKVELGIDGTGTGIIIDGDLYVGDADSWENVGQVRGPAGTSSHLYVKRANSLNPSSFDINGRYIGYYVSETVMTDDDLRLTLLEQPSKWNGTKGNGDDGGGYEEIFLLTKNGTPVELPTKSENQKDYCPEHNLGDNAFGSINDAGKGTGSDIFLLPNETYPYCGKAKRNVTVSNYAGAGYGDKNGKAILCDVYVKDGVTAYHLELTNDQGIIPIENGKEEDVTLETTMMLYAGDTLITEDDGVNYSIEYGNKSKSFGSGDISILNSELTGIETITCVATHNGNPFKKEFKILRTENAYEIRPNVEIFHRDLSTNKLTNGKCKVHVSKGNHYRDLYQSLNGQYLYFDCYGIDGEEISVGGNKTALINNGIANVDLSEISGINKVEFYLVLSDNTRVSEVVGVVTNGADNYASEAIYILGSEDSIPKNPTPISSQRKNYNSSEGLPKDLFTENENSYTNKDGSIVSKTEALEGSDNPLFVTDTKNYCYVSVRKYDTMTQTGGEFSDPVPYSCKVKGDSAISSNMTIPILFKNESDNTLVNKTVYITVNSYIGSTRRKISTVKVEGIETLYHDDYNLGFDYTSSIDDSTITFNVTVTFDDEGSFTESLTCNVYTKVDGKNAISPIAVHLSNPSVELSGYASGNAITNSAKCIVTSVRGNTPLPITIGRGYYDAFQITYTGNGSQNVLVTIYASSQIPPGQYTISLPLTIAGNTLIRDINVTVKEIPNDTINIVMDEHHTVGCSKKVIGSKTTRSTRTTFPDTDPTLPNPDQVLVWDGTLLDTSIYQPINEICEIKYEPNVVIPVTIFVNGVPYKEGSIDSISLGDTVLTSGTDFGLVKLQYSNSGSVSISAKPILECMGETSHYINGQITFKIGDESIVKNVIFHELNESSELTTTGETDILPLSANYGETIQPYIVTKKYGDNGGEERYRGGDIKYAFRIEGEDEYFTPGTRAIEITDNLKIHVYRVEYQRQCETDEYGEGCQDDIDHPDYTELFSQTISCIKQPKLDIGTLESETQFAQVNSEALTGDGKLVGKPIKLIVKHYNGDEVTVYNSVTEILPYRVCAGMEGNKYCGLTTSTLQFDQQWLYETTAPIKFTLEDANGEVKDSIEIEKTIVYPNPLIYPAGEYTADKSYKINYSQVPYIFIKTSSGDVKYYVGNRDVLKDNAELDLKNTITIDGNDIYIKDVNGFLAGNSMESFEAIYADIGVLNQALVGPLVFYKDYVFSQEGVMSCNYDNYKEGDIVSYEDAIIFEKEFEDVLTLGQPNYLLNAKTGELKFGNSFHYANGETTLTLGDHIVLNGETGTIKLDENSDGGNSKLTIGDDNFFGTQSTSDDSAYVGKFAISPILQAGCYGGGVCEIDAYDHGKHQHHIGSHCISETFDDDEIPALTVKSNTGASICNFTGGIYGLRTGVGGNQSYNWSYSSVTFKPQTLIYNRSGQYTLTLPNPEYAQGGDFIDIYKFTTDYFYIKGARFTPLAGGDEISDDLYVVSSDDIIQSKYSITTSKRGWYRCLFNPDDDSWYVMKLSFSDI